MSDLDNFFDALPAELDRRIAEAAPGTQVSYALIAADLDQSGSYVVTNVAPENALKLCRALRDWAERRAAELKTARSAIASAEAWAAKAIVLQRMSEKIRN